MEKIVIGGILYSPRKLVRYKKQQIHARIVIIKSQNKDEIPF